jgi:septum formation protein
LDESIAVRLTLISASPRREELLRRLGVPFDILPSGASEVWQSRDPGSLAMHNARRKLERSSLYGDRSRVLLSADTIIWTGDGLLGKPVGAESARRMLTRLAGTSHRVYTGVCVQGPDTREGTIVEAAVAVSSVVFYDLSASEVDAYIGSGEWKDKAGAYAIQGKGGSLVASVEGEYENVVGLPLHLIRDIISQKFVHCRFC